MTIENARHALITYTRYHDGCARYIVCVNVADVCLHHAAPVYTITDWADGSVVETYVRGKLV